ncbi:hypothetical protein N7490_011915 [Penicillium lividum]|nr:hypothetical protein N7490_011915 [Penicillium lividum]
MANTDCSSSYYDAIHALRKSFGVNGASVKFEMIPTAMCLAMAELMIPDSAAATAEHIKAVGLLFQAYGPDVCKDGFPHKLFVGFRPLLIIQAILHRNSTFLALPAWINTPFSTFGPSLMQQLLNEAITLPSLLHQADLLIKNSELTIDSHINQVFSSFVDLTSRLGNWETMLCVESRPPYWHSGNASDDTILPLWYPNITMANVFTHLWALQIICMTEIKRLSSYLSRSSRELHPQLDSRIDENDLLMIALARKIYTSMDYLLQDEMELFGPASTFFPLRVAHQIFIADESGYKMDIVYIEGIVDRLARKGLLSVHSFVFDI